MTDEGPVPAEGYQLSFTLSPWPSLLVDRTLCHVRAANQAAEAFWSSGGNLIDRPLADLLLLEDDLPALSTGMSRTSWARRDGESLPLLLVALSDELLLLQILYSGPVSAELERLQRASRHKSELIANISHELRTPLTAILGWPEILLDAPDMPELALMAANSIRKDGAYLRSLLEDLIDLSRIEAGHLQLEIQSEDFGQIVLDAVDMLADKARRKGLALHYDLPEQPVKVAADAVRILQVVLNYLNNAIKYTDKGEIRIQLVLDEDEAILSLRDSGIGMDESVRQHIFERFMRADEVQSTDGAGIGLSLVKKLVGLHGGRCWVESEPGVGSTFYVALPLAKTEAPSEAAWALRARRGRGPRLDRLRLLVIDERPEELSLLTQLLQPAFGEVKGLGQLPAPAALKADPPHVILVSTSLQDEAHGVWLAALRTMRGLAELPVIALSASAMKGDAEKLQALGFSGSRSKPFQKEDLLQYIQSLLRKPHA